MEIEVAYTNILNTRNTYGQVVIKINLAENFKLFPLKR